MFDSLIYISIMYMGFALLFGWVRGNDQEYEILTFVRHIISLE